MLKFQELSRSGEVLCSVVELDGDGYPAARISSTTCGDIADCLIKLRLATGRECLGKGAERRGKEARGREGGGRREERGREEEGGREERGREDGGGHEERGRERGGGREESGRERGAYEVQNATHRGNRETATQAATSPRPSQNSANYPKSPSAFRPKESPSGLQTALAPQSPSGHNSFHCSSLQLSAEEQITVVHINSLLDFFINLVSSSAELETLMDEIAEYCSSGSAQSVDHVAPGQPLLAQFSTDQSWYRAVVIECKPSSVAVVKFVDYGDTDTLPHSSLLSIPPPFLFLPAQAIHCSLYGVGVQASAEAAKTAFIDLVLEQVATGLVKSTRIVSDSGEIVCSLDLTLSDGTKVLDALVGRGHVSIPRSSLSNILPASSPVLTEIQPPLIHTDTPMDVVVSYVESPLKFFVQLVESFDNLQQLTADMQEVYTQLSEQEEVILSLDTGVFCAARFREDDVWYRARVTSVDESAVLVWFVDYGNEDSAQASDLKSLRVSFTVQRGLSVPCRLDGLSPSAELSQDVASWFGDIVTRQGTKLVAQFAKSLSSYSDVIPVRLYDTARAGVDCDIAQLLDEKHAANSKLGHTQTPILSDEPKPKPSLPSSGAAHPSVAIPPACPTLNTPLSCSVTHVNSPSEFYCQLMSSAETVDDLLNSLYAHYAEVEGGGVLLENPAVGLLCAAKFSADGSWYRAEISCVTSEICTVQFIDYGNSEDVVATDLRVLENPFMFEPRQAIRCSLTGIGPIGSREWSEECRCQFNDTILDQECLVTILSTVGGGGGGSYCVLLEVADYDIASKLVSEGLAQKAPLADDKDDSVANPSLPSSFLPSRPSPPPPHALSVAPYPLEVGNDYHVYVTTSCSPSLLYCQITSSDGAFDSLMAEIAEYCTIPETSTKEMGWVRDDVVLAQFSEDLAWYRARVTVQSAVPTSADVLFIDYGNGENQATVRPLPEQFCAMPAQAVPCQLDGAADVDLLDEAAFNDFVISEGGFTMRVVWMEGGDVCVSLCMGEDGRSVLEVAVERGVLVRRGGEGEEEGRQDVMGGQEVNKEGSGFVAMPITLGSKEEGFISHLKSPDSFWIQLGFTEGDLTSLCEALATAYSSPVELRKLALPDPRPGQTCCAQFSKDQCWYRSTIIHSDGEEFKVHFVDWGNSESVSSKGIRLLKQEFLDLPLQAVHCQLSGASPVGENWSDESITCFSSLVEDKALTAEFLNLSSGIWNVRLFTQDNEVATVMAKQDAAVTSSVQSAALQNSPKATQNLPVSSDQNLLEAPSNSLAGEISTVPELELKEGESYEVYLSHLTTTPTEFYCQLAGNSTSLDELMAAVSDYYSSNSPPPSLVEGALCVAQYSGNNAWYRARITSVSEVEGELDGLYVHFIDYGNCETVAPHQVCSLHCSLARLASQAFCCSLSEDTSLHVSSERMEQFLSLDNNQCYHIIVTHRLDDRYVVKLTNFEGTSLNDIILSSDEAESPTLLNSFATPSSSFPSLSYPPATSLDVYLSHIDSPLSFYCQPLELAAKLDGMMSQLGDIIMMSPPPSLSAVITGLPCLAQFSEDQEWYRAVLREGKGEEEIVAHFVDYGNSEITSLSLLRQLPASLLKMPIQALHCSVFDPTTTATGDIDWEHEKVEEFRSLLGDNFSLTITSTREDGMCVCEVSIDEGPIDFTSILPTKGERGLREGSLPLASKEENEAGEEEEENEFSPSTPGSRRGEGESHLDPLTLPGRSLLNISASELGSVAANISTMAVRGSNLSSQLTTESEASEETSEQGEGEPLIKAPYTLTLSNLEQLEVNVVYIESPSLIYLQRCELQPEMEKLSAEIEQYCASFAEKQYQENFHRGDFVLAHYDADETWYRAKVIAVADDGSAQVSFIDYGNSELIASEKMIMCPQHVLALPCQAIACSLSGVPRRENWPVEYKKLMEELVLEQVVKVRVVHPASEGMMSSVAMEIADSGVDIAQRVLVHLQEECDRGNLSNYIIPEEPKGESPNREPSEERETPSAAITSFEVRVPKRELGMKSRHEVYVTSCESPCAFTCQLASESEQLEAMVTTLQEIYSSLSSSLLPSRPVEVGDCVCAQFTEDNAWYRAKVIAMVADDPVELCYIDYGNKEVLPSSSLRLLHPSLLYLPPFALECFLAALEPAGSDNEFSSEATGLLLSLTTDNSCTMELLSTTPTGHYGINLINEEGVNVADALIEAHLASFSKDNPPTAQSVATGDAPEATQPDERAAPVISEQKMQMLTEVPLPMDASVTTAIESYVTSQAVVTDMEEIAVETGTSVATATDKPDEAASAAEFVAVAATETESLKQDISTSYKHALETGLARSVKVVSVTSLDQLKCLLTDCEEEFNSLMVTIATRNYVAGSNELAMCDPKPGQPVCVCCHDNMWRRAKIGSVLSPQRVKVSLVDLGTTEDVPLSRAKLLESSLSSIPPLVVSCSLRPLTDWDLDPARLKEGAWELVWPSSCLQHFRELVKEGREVRVSWEGVGEGGVCVVRVLVRGEGEEEEVDVRDALVHELRRPKILYEEEEEERERRETESGALSKESVGSGEVSSDHLQTVLIVDGVKCDSGDGAEGASGDGMMGASGDGVEGASGDGVMGDGMMGDSGDGVKGDSGDGVEGASGDGVEGDSSDGVKGDSGDGVKGDSGDGVKGDSGDGVEDASGDGVKGDSGDGVKGDSGDGVEDASGDGVKGNSGDGVKGSSGDGVKGDSGDGVKGDKKETTKANSEAAEETKLSQEVIGLSGGEEVGPVAMGYLTEMAASLASQAISEAKKEMREEEEEEREEEGGKGEKRQEGEKERKNEAEEKEVESKEEEEAEGCDGVTAAQGGRGEMLPGTAERVCVCVCVCVRACMHAHIIPCLMQGEKVGAL